MRIFSVSRLTGLSPDQIRYIEQKGYVQSSMIVIKTRKVRDYSSDDISLLESISNYLSLGYRYDVAHAKALEDRANPRHIGQVGTNPFTPSRSYAFQCLSNMKDAGGFDY